MFGDPLGDWCCDSVTALFVALTVAVVFAVGTVEGVTVRPAHESFAFNWGESAYCKVRLSDRLTTTLTSQRRKVIYRRLAVHSLSMAKTYRLGDCVLIGGLGASVFGECDEVGCVFVVACFDR